MFTFAGEKNIDRVVRAIHKPKGSRLMVGHPRAWRGKSGFESPLLSKSVECWLTAERIGAVRKRHIYGLFQSCGVKVRTRGFGSLGWGSIPCGTTQVRGAVHSA